VAEWQIEQPTTLELDEDVRALEVRLVSGHVDVVTKAGTGATVEVVSVDGEPLLIRIEDGQLSIRHGLDDRLGSGWLGWLRIGGVGLGRMSERRAVVAIAVPTSCPADVGVVAADAVVSGLEGRVSIKSVSGDITIDESRGPVTVDSVSGDVEARGLVGDLAVKSVSGELTLVEGRPASLRAKNISGDITLDLSADPTAPADASGLVNIDVTTVSGDVTVRVPGDADLQVDVTSTTGDVSSAFGDLSLSSRPGAHRLHGRLGRGAGALRGRTVSGRVALLSRSS
jgi:hypothetical protein